MKRIVSFLTARKIEFERSFDHTLSWFRGVPLGRYSKITADLYLGGRPFRRGIKTLQKWGITGIVSMRLTTPPEIFFDAGFTVLHLPTPDQTPPKLSDFEKGVAFIQSEIDKGGKVYIHCWFGEGRGPSMAIAYLISQGLTLEDATEQIKKVRTFIRPTLEQIAQLKNFEQQVFKG